MPNGGVNPSGTELSPQYEYANRDQPPPYSPSDVISNQPVIQQTFILPVSLKDSPIYYNCTGCGDRILTKVKYVNSRKTHLIAGFICGCTSWCLACCLGLLPYYLKPFKKAEHYCPNCDKLLGTYSKI